jgi:hypothetical protein
MPTKEKIESYAEREALGQYLSEWDNALSFDEIIAMLESETQSDKITVWEPFEYTPGSAVADLLNDYVANTVDSVERFLKTL